MSNDSMGRNRSSGGGAPMGSTVAIVVTAVAVILGFLILRKVNDKQSTGSVSGGGGTTLPVSTTLPTQETTATTPAPTQPSVDKKSTKVQVANASKISGVAKQLTQALKDAGFDVSTATNASVTTPAATTKVIYDQSDPNALGVATLVAAALGNVPVEISPNPPPVKDGSFSAGSKVIVLLGTDLAGKPLAGTNGSVGAVTQSSAATSST
jgi:hypothetical protein